MKITVIDFETANPSRVSACSIGVAVIEGGAITTRFERLIKPPKGFDGFNPMFTGIHGLTQQDVRAAPGFDVVFQELRPHFENALLAAHNAAFDMSVLRALLAHYGLSHAGSYLCTLAVARAAWPQLPEHKLGTVAAHLGVELKHHQAGSDAYAAAHIILALLAKKPEPPLQALRSWVKPFARP